MHNVKIIEKYLQELLLIPSPTGYTNEISNYIKRELEEMNIDYKISNKGIIVATIQGKNPKRNHFLIPYRYTRSNS